MSDSSSVPSSGAAAPAPFLRAAVVLATGVDSVVEVPAAAARSFFEQEFRASVPCPACGAIGACFFGGSRGPECGACGFSRARVLADVPAPAPAAAAPAPAPARSPRVWRPVGCSGCGAPVRYDVERCGACGVEAWCAVAAEDVLPPVRLQVGSAAAPAPAPHEAAPSSLAAAPASFSPAVLRLESARLLLAGGAR